MMDHAKWDDFEAHVLEGVQAKLAEARRLATADNPLTGHAEFEVTIELMDGRIVKNHNEREELFVDDDGGGEDEPVVDPSAPEHAVR
jgi:hypothetical protein